MVRVGRGVWGLGLYLTHKEVYVPILSLLLCAGTLPGSLILFKFQPFHGIWISGVLRLKTWGEGGGGGGGGYIFGNLINN